MHTAWIKQHLLNFDFSVKTGLPLWLSGFVPQTYAQRGSASADSHRNRGDHWEMASENDSPPEPAQRCRREIFKFIAYMNNFKQLYHDCTIRLCYSMLEYQ